MLDIYQIVTDRITAQLEAGTVPWRKPWGTYGASRNAITNKPYRGINVFLLAGCSFNDPRWLSFKQAQDLGGSVRKGEKGTPVVF